MVAGEGADGGGVGDEVVQADRTCCLGISSVGARRDG